ncbi:MAG: DUF1269 domain-containing protein [Hyphomicrobiaceae bacterium]
MKNTLNSETWIVFMRPCGMNAIWSRVDLVHMQGEHLLGWSGAVVATGDDNGKTKLHRSGNVTEIGATSRAWRGRLASMLFLNPFVGRASGARVGALAGTMTDFEIDDRFNSDVGKASGRMRRRYACSFAMCRKARFSRGLKTIPERGGILRPRLR